MKKRLAIVTNSMCIGGIEFALINMLKSIDYEHYDVTLFLKDQEGELYSQIDNRVEVKYWGVAETGVSCNSDITLWELQRNIYGRSMAILHQRNWILNDFFCTSSFHDCDAREYDCAIAYQGLCGGVLATTLCRLRAKKRICWIHMHNYFHNEYCNTLHRIYQKFDSVFCVSESVARSFGQQFSKTKKKVLVCRNIMNCWDIREKANGELDNEIRHLALLTVGRLATAKGQQMIPAAVRLLVNAGYDINWYLVGDGSLREEIEREAIKNGVADRVILLGTKENPYPYIKNCDIYVQPSFTEGYCTTTMEAKILCKPIVTTDAPGMREQFVSGENGLIVDSMTPEALAQGIITLLDHPEIMEKFQNALKKESYDTTKELQKLYDLMES